jgi:DNA polymerase-3 subunit epsilon
MKGSMDVGGCFPTGRHYPGIAHLIRVTVEGLSKEWTADLDIQQIPWVSIDTETTGRDATTDRVIEVGFVFLKGGKITGRQGWLINPECPIPEEASQVHGILDKDVADKPTFAQMAMEMLEAADGYLPLAYNAAFDRAFLLQELGRLPPDAKSATLPPAFRPDTEWMDPLDWARELQKEHKSRALGEVCERLGIPLENAHRATDDAAAAGLVMSAFLAGGQVPRAYGAFIKEQKRLHRIYEFERVRWR